MMFSGIVSRASALFLGLVGLGLLFAADCSEVLISVIWNSSKQNLSD